MSDTWNEWRRRILYQLEVQGGAIEDIRRSLADIDKDIVGLKMRAGLWGALAGMVPVLAAVLWTLLS